jgi:tRNA A-37 threonylcarbamoyl transferase component Bud32
VDTSTASGPWTAGQGRLHSGPPAARHRRPSGEPPPLPRQLQRSGRWWGLAGVLLVVFWIAAAYAPGPVPDLVQRLDDRVAEAAVDLRTGWLTSLARVVNSTGVVWALRLLGWAAVIVPLVARRSRHTLVFIGALLLVTLTATLVATVLARPRPLPGPALADWEGFAHPSVPVAALTATLVGAGYALVPQGRWRQRAKVVTALVVTAVAAARVYLLVDHATDALAGAVLGVVVPLMAFRLLTPNEVFPVTYRRGRSAHLDVGGSRGTAIRAALRDQLGLEVVDVQPFGLGGSAGSTPLKIQLNEDTFLFGKLYAANHLRADRWYKLGRTLLYGRLEDEVAFHTVRRLVQYEDYLLRYIHEAELPCPEPYGFVEITPEREYLLVTDFLTGAVEIGDVDVTDDLIDAGLRLVRRMWDVGLAHRDIKPSNLLVRDDEVLLIDVAFAEIRPSPWRQAVDLANMMLTLAVRSDVQRVYDRARLLFTPEEIAEAFAATRGVTSPTQLRGMLRASGRDLVAEFRRLAPPRRPISIQRWSLRRVGLWAWVLLLALISSALLVTLLQAVDLL